MFKNERNPVKSKAMLEYEQMLMDKQLACRSRWISSRIIYRKLKEDPPDWFAWLEKSLDGTGYTLTEDVFEEIKKKYNELTNEK